MGKQIIVAVGKMQGQQLQFCPKPSNSSLWMLLYELAGGAAAELACYHNAGCSSLFPDASSH